MKTKMMHANVIKNKGQHDHYAIERVAIGIMNMRYRHFIFESGRETAILSVKVAVTRIVTAMKGE